MGIDIGKTQFSTKGLISCPQIARGIRTISNSEYAQSQAIILLSDSTSNETTEWFYQMLTKVASEFSSLRIKYALFDDTSKEYGAWTTVNAGNGNGDEWVQIKTDYGRFLPASEMITPATADLDIRVDLAADDWTPGSPSRRIIKRGDAFGTAKVIWHFTLLSDGKLRWAYTTDGSTETTRDSTASVGASDGTRRSVRVTVDADNGATGHTVTFYTSSDDGLGNVTWTQLGTAVTTAGVLPTLYSTADDYYSIGANYNSNLCSGKFYDVEIRDGIGGTIINPKPIQMWRRVTPATQDSPIGGSPTLYVLNASMSGQGLTYHQANYTKTVHRYAPATVMISTSHNDGTLDGTTLTSPWDTLTAAIKTRAPVCSLAGVLQNPEVSLATYWREHNMRVQQLRTYFRRNGFDTINLFDPTYEYATAQGVTVTSLLDGLGIHPGTTLSTALGVEAFRQLFGYTPA
jgi:hypothetical protein